MEELVQVACCSQLAEDRLQERALVVADHVHERRGHREDERRPARKRRCADSSGGSSPFTSSGFIAPGRSTTASLLAPGSPLLPAFPPEGQWHLGTRSPVTVAGPRRTHTGFLEPVAALKIWRSVSTIRRLGAKERCVSNASRRSAKRAT